MRRGFSSMYYQASGHTAEHRCPNQDKLFWCLNARPSTVTWMTVEQLEDLDASWRERRYRGCQENNEGPTSFDTCELPSEAKPGSCKKDQLLPGVNDALISETLLGKGRGRVVPYHVRIWLSLSFSNAKEEASRLIRFRSSADI